jgi:hypothetical protein
MTSKAPTKKRPKKRRRSAVAIANSLQFRNLYEQGYSVTEIAAEHDVSRQWVYKQLHAMGVKVATRKEMHGVYYEPRIFKKFQPEQAYFVGALYARGRFKRNNTRLLYEITGKDCGQFDQFQNWLELPKDPNRRSLLIRYTGDTKKDLMQTWGLNARKRGPTQRLCGHYLCEFFCRGFWEHGVGFSWNNGCFRGRVAGPSGTIRIFKAFVEPRLGYSLTTTSCGFGKRAVTVSSTVLPYLADILYATEHKSSVPLRIEGINYHTSTGEPSP